MRSLQPLSRTSLASSWQIQRPFWSPCRIPPDDYLCLRRRCSTVLHVTLNKDPDKNATETEGNIEITAMDENLIELDKVSSSEATLSEPTPESTSGPSKLNDALYKPTEGNSPSFLGMTPNAVFALNLVAIIWGTQHAVVKMVVDDADAGPFTLLRFAIGAAIASIPLLKSSQSGEETAINCEAQEYLLDASVSEISEQQRSTKDGTLNTVWRWGAEMGFWMFLGFAFQAIGLASTTAQRSGFLLYLNVKFVPFFAFLLLGRKISVPTLVSAFTAFGGTALLAYDGTSWSLNQGDLWSIAAAAASAMYILRLDKASKEVGDNNSIELNAACLWIVTLLSGLWSFATVEDASLLGLQLIHIVTSHPLEIVYLSAVTTALANYIQTKSQKKISVERASVIYAMDPVYGAVFSNLLLGETLTSLGFVGAGLITAAAATNAFLDLRTSDEGENADGKTRKSQ